MNTHPYTENYLLKNSFHSIALSLKLASFFSVEKLQLLSFTACPTRVLDTVKYFSLSLKKYFLFYNHPKFTYPSLYDDIAVIELGRRISYDVDKVKQ